MLLSGGVSMGKYDLVEEVLEDLGAEFFFTGVKMQPGKPLVFGRLPATDEFPSQFFFGLPGNPISTQVTFHCFVEPLLRAMSGAAVQGPRFVQATLAEDVAGKSWIDAGFACAVDKRTAYGRRCGWWDGRDQAIWRRMRERTAMRCCRQTGAVRSWGRHYGALALDQGCCGRLV